MNINLNCEDRGAGEPLILLHGNGGSGQFFKHQMDFFSKEYRVMAIDTRGHGKSPRGNRPFTIKQFAEDLHKFMCERGIEKANLLGFSDGGNIAITFALKYPDMVESLIISGANLYPQGVKASVQVPIVISYYLIKFFSKYSRKSERLGLMVKQPDIRPLDLEKLQMPALVMAGTNDIIKETHTRLIKVNLPNSKLLFIKGGHSILQTQHEKVNRAVGNFLKEKSQNERME